MKGCKDNMIDCKNYIIKKIETSNGKAEQYIFELNRQLNNTHLNDRWRISKFINNINKSIDARNEILNRIFSLDYMDFGLKLGTLSKLNLLDNIDRKSRKMIEA